MRSLSGLLLLLTACLAVNASSVPTLPDDIQVQENFDLSRVRLASLAVMAGCLSGWALLAGRGKSYVPWGLSLCIWNSRGGSLRALSAAQTVRTSLKLHLCTHPFVGFWAAILSQRS